MSIKILIGADICPTKTNFGLFEKCDTEALIGKKLLSLLKGADYTIFNLETPLTDTLSPIAKNGPCLAAPTATINGLKAINSHFFTLSNNHILDQGIQGLNSTMALLEKANIAYAGVGENLQAAGKPYIADIQGVKLGIYCCAEHEFSIATDTTAGANPYDPLISFDAVKELKKNSDFVIVLYHGGKEHYRYPSPQIQKIFRKFADCGANLVIAQHTHCIGCKEEYNGATLLYGQGNFLFDHSTSEYWQNNLLIELNIEKSTKKVSINYIPCVKQDNGVRLAKEQEVKQILTDFKNRSEQIQQPGFIAEEYKIFANKLYNSYLQSCSGWFGRNLFVRTLNKLTGHRLLKYFYFKKDLLRIQNLLDCEAHREVFLQSIKGKNK